MFPIPKIYEYAGMAIVVALFGGFMYFKGWSGEHDKLVSYEATIKAMGEQQQAIVKEKDKENEDTANYIAGQYDSYFKRLRQHSSGGNVPQANSCTKGADGSSASGYVGHFTDEEVKEQAGKLYFLQQLLIKDGVQVN